MSFGLITFSGLGRCFEPTNVIHPQDKVEKIIQSSRINSRDALLSRVKTSY